MTDADRYEHQLRQRLTASSLVEQAAWGSRMPHEVLRRLLVSDQINKTGVIDGLRVTPQAATLNTQVGGGLALYYDSTLSAPESRHRWIEVYDDAPITVTHDPGDATRPRWDVVEIAPGTANGLGSILDFYNPATGVFVPALANPNKVCSPAVTIRQGTPSATPKFPAGIDGVIPLAYVYVPALATAILATDILYCRPLLRPMTREISGSPAPVAPTIRGGGIRVPSDGNAGATTSEMTGLFKASSIQFFVPTQSDMLLSVNSHDGGSLPGASGLIYFYLVPPSAVYPAGYSAWIGEREFYIETATRIAGGYDNGMNHAVYLSSAKAPRTTIRGQPATPASFSIVHPTFGSVSIDTESAVYICSAFFDLGLGTMVLQRCFGDKISGRRKTGIKIDGDLPIAASVYSVAAHVTGQDAYAMPPHVVRARLEIQFDVDPNSYAELSLLDQMGKQANTPALTWTYTNAGATFTNPLAVADFWVHLDALQISVLAADYGSGGDAYIYVYEWEDPILAMR